MRSIIYLIILGAAGYLGYNYYMEKMGGASGEASTPAAETASARPDAQAAAAAPAKTVQVFKSKIVIPDGPAGEKHTAKPGYYYVLERASVQHETGVAAVVPGDEVKLLQRKDNGVMKVISTVGRYEFELKESQVTNDLDVAQAAERKFGLTHPVARP